MLVYHSSVQGNTSAPEVSRGSSTLPTSARSSPSALQLPGTIPAMELPPTSSLCWSFSPPSLAAKQLPGRRLFAAFLPARRNPHPLV